MRPRSPSPARSPSSACGTPSPRSPPAARSGCGCWRSTGSSRRLAMMRTCVRIVYTELHAHSAYSFLDGASLPEEMALAAVEKGYEAMALVDHDSVAGSMEFAVAGRALGLRTIHGAEVTLADGRHLTLLVQDARGWSGLCRILPRAHAHTRDGREGAPATPPATPLEVVLEHSEGLVCLTGCAAHGIEDEPTARRLLEA